MGIQYYIRSDVIIWLPCASQLVQEIMLEEAEAAKASRAEASVDVALRDNSKVTFLQCLLLLKLSFLNSQLLQYIAIIIGIIG